MLSREHRVKNSFFTERRKPDFIVQKQQYTIKVYKNGSIKAQVSVVVPKKAQKTAVSRNNLRRRVFKVFTEYIQNMQPATYIVYVQKDSKELVSLIQHEIQQNFLDK